MKRKKAIKQHTAEELSEAQLNALLLEIGKALKEERSSKTSQEIIAYELSITRKNFGLYEKGGDMYLSTFLKILHGLGISGSDFFKRIEKK